MVMKSGLEDVARLGHRNSLLGTSLRIYYESNSDS